MRDGNTVPWGIKTAIAKLETPPDVIFHKGDFGKEPMILIFGKDPEDVLRKILKLVR
jgi:hydroxymethylpyrimidine/phosphomethylpyrimidine kinase